MAKKFLTPINMNSNKINNLLSGTSPSDAINLSQLTGAVSGSTNSIPKFTSANVLGNSSITDNGSVVTFSNNINLGNSTPLIDFNSASLGAPTFTTRSTGTKVVYYGNMSGATVDYATGMESVGLWHSVASTSQQFKWYGGTTLAAQLTGAGVLNLPASNAYMNFSGGSLGAPTFTTRSGGTKLLLYDNLSGSQTDYAIGMESSGIWNSVATTSQSFKWYGATTLAAQLTGTGTFSPAGNIAMASGMNMNFPASSVAAPTLTTRSSGTKMVWYPNVDASNVDYATGIESGTLWNSVPSNGNNFKWYAGTTQIAQLAGNGVFSAGYGIFQNYARVRNGSNGYIDMNDPGSTTLTGFIGFNLGNNQRRGYIGSSSANMLYYAENGAVHQFEGGNLTVGSNKIQSLAAGTVSTDAVNKGQLTTEVPSVIAGLTDLPIGNRYTQREWRKTITMGGSYAANAYWDICTITQGSLQGSLLLNAIIEGSGFGQSMYAELPLSYNMDWYPTVTGASALTAATWYEIPVRNFQNRHLLPNESDISFLFQFNGNTINLRLRSNIAAPGSPVFKFTMIYKGLIADADITDLNTTGTFSTAVTRIADVMGTRVSQIAVPNRMAIKTSLIIGNSNITSYTPSNAFEVTGTGSFSGNLTVPNGTTSGHAINLSQLTGAVSGTTGYHAKFTGTNTLGNSLIYDNGTNVGIGNTNNIFKLDVSGTLRFQGWHSLSDVNTLNGGYSNNVDDDEYWFNYRGYLDGFTRFRSTTISNGKGGRVLSVVGSTGYVGIGITPTSKFHVLTTSDASPSNNTTQFKIESSSTNNINFGLLSGTPYAGYMQVGSSGGGTTYYPLALQPLGNNVYIGASTDNGSSAKLQVTGNVHSSGTATATKFYATSTSSPTNNNASVMSYNSGTGEIQIQGLGLFVSNTIGTGISTFNIDCKNKQHIYQELIISNSGNSTVDISVSNMVSGAVLNLWISNGSSISVTFSFNSSSFGLMRSRSSGTLNNETVASAANSAYLREFMSDGTKMYAKTSY